MTQPLVVIAAGGTGGHMFPAQALSEEMLARGWRVRLSTDARGARYAGGFPAAVHVVEVSAATTARGGVLARLAVPFRVMAGIMAARRAMRADRPAVVVGFGGYPSVPALAAAWLLGIPRVIHEANGVPGRVNRLFAPRVDVVACGVWPTMLPGNANGRHTGNPVRAAVQRKAAAPYPVPGEGRDTLLVIGGSQGARVLSDLLPEAVALLPDAMRARLRVVQQARPEDRERVAAFYARHGIDAEVAEFFDDIAERLAGASLVVARAGASTVADLTVVGRPSILIPYPHASDDHQTANARPLAEAGAAVMIRESGLAPAELARHIATILGDPLTAFGMAQAALSLGRPDAVAALADLVESVARRKTAAPPE